MDYRLEAKINTSKRGHGNKHFRLHLGDEDSLRDFMAMEDLRVSKPKRVDGARVSRKVNSRCKFGGQVYESFFYIDQSAAYNIKFYERDGFELMARRTKIARNPDAERHLFMFVAMGYLSVMFVNEPTSVMYAEQFPDRFHDNEFHVDHHLVYIYDDFAPPREMDLKRYVYVSVRKSDVCGLEVKYGHFHFWCSLNIVRTAPHIAHLERYTWKGKDYGFFIADLYSFNLIPGRDIEDLWSNSTLAKRWAAAVRSKVMPHGKTLTHAANANIMKQWNKFMHSLNGNIFDLVLPLLEMNTLDGCRDPVSGEVKFNDPEFRPIIDAIEGEYNLTDDDIKRVYSVDVLFNRVIDVVPMTSEERLAAKQYLEKLGDDVTDADKTEFLSRFFTVNRRGDRFVITSVATRPKRNNNYHKSNKGILNVASVPAARGTGFVEGIRNEPMTRDFYVKYQDIIDVVCPNLLLANYDEMHVDEWVRMVDEGAVGEWEVPLIGNRLVAFQEKIKWVKDARSKCARDLADLQADNYTTLNKTYVSSNMVGDSIDTQMSRLIAGAELFREDYVVEGYYKEKVDGDTRPFLERSNCLFNPGVIRTGVVTVVRHSYRRCVPAVLFLFCIIVNVVFGCRLGIAETESTYNKLFSYDLFNNVVNRCSRGRRRRDKMVYLDANYDYYCKCIQVGDTIDRDDLYDMTYLLSVAALNVNDDRFLDESLGFSDCMDMDLNGMISRNILGTVTESSSMSSLEKQPLLLIPVLLLGIFFLACAGLPILFQITPLLQDLSMQSVIDWVKRQSDYQAMLNVMSVILYAVGVVDSLFPFLRHSHTILIHGLTLLITTLLDVKSFEEYTVNTYLLVSCLRSLGNSVMSLRLLSPNFTNPIKLIVQSILGQTLLSVFSALCLRQLRKPFIQLSSSLSMSDLQSAWFGFNENLVLAKEGKGSSLSLISQALKLISVGVSWSVLNWKFIGICAVTFIIIWVLISQMENNLISYSPRSLGRMSVMVKTLIILLLLVGCQARCLHPLAMDSQISYSTPLCLNDVDVVISKALLKEMMACSQQQYYQEVITQLVRTTLISDSESNLMLMTPYQRARFVEWYILTYMEQSSATFESYLENLDGILDLLAPQQNDMYHLWYQNYSLALQNVRSVLSSPQLLTERSVISSNYTVTTYVLILTQWRKISTILNDMHKYLPQMRMYEKVSISDSMVVNIDIYMEDSKRLYANWTVDLNSQEMNGLSMNSCLESLPKISSCSRMSFSCFQNVRREFFKCYNITAPSWLEMLQNMYVRRTRLYKAVSQFSAEYLSALHPLMHISMLTNITAVEEYILIPLVQATTADSEDVCGYNLTCIYHHENSSLINSAIYMYANLLRINPAGLDLKGLTLFDRGQLLQSLIIIDAQRSHDWKNTLQHLSDVAFKRARDNESVVRAVGYVLLGVVADTNYFITIDFDDGVWRATQEVGWRLFHVETSIVFNCTHLSVMLDGLHLNAITDIMLDFLPACGYDGRE